MSASYTFWDLKMALLLCHPERIFVFRGQHLPYYISKEFKFSEVFSLSKMTFFFF